MCQFDMSCLLFAFYTSNQLLYNCTKHVYYEIDSRSFVQGSNVESINGIGQRSKGNPQHPNFKSMSFRCLSLRSWLSDHAEIFWAHCGYICMADAHDAVNASPQFYLCVVLFFSNGRDFRNSRNTPNCLYRCLLGLLQYSRTFF